MGQHVDLLLFKEILIVLGAVSVVIPLFHRLRISPVLGFMLIGILLGPGVVGAWLREVPGMQWASLSDSARIETIAEFGVVFLMFMIGLELSFERLLLVRRLVFGLGPLQTLGCGALIALATLVLGQSTNDAIVIGLAFALSSTAIIIQVLADEKRLSTNMGRTSFAILLFQDIAVVPILFAVAMMGNAGDQANLQTFIIALGQAALAVAVLIGMGRLLLRPLFRSVVRTQSPEVFMAACLLVLLGAAAATAAAGLSMAMGALLAGLLLAETEYRRQIEVLIEPFKGLLLGLFLISMGMTLNLAAIAAAPLLIFGLSLALLLIKSVVTYGFARFFAVPARASLQMALLFGAGGEFTFVVLGAATAQGMLSGRLGEIAVIIAALTMAATPLLSAMGLALTKRLRPPNSMDAAAWAPPAPPESPCVIIVGYGRVGQMVGEVLIQQAFRHVAIDTNVDIVGKARAQGAPVYYGDATNPLMLRACGLDTALALVVTMDSAKGTEEVVAAARAARGDLIIVARARDTQHAKNLYQKGATSAVPETVEASLMLSEMLLTEIGVPQGQASAMIQERRERMHFSMR